MKAHEEVLLAESGELPEADRAALEQRLATDAELRAFREATRKLTRVAADHLPDDGPSPRVLAVIEAEARMRVRGRVIRFPVPWSRIAAAAVAALVAGVWLATRGTPDARAESERLANALALVEAVDGMDHETGEVPEAATLEVLARRLLRLQGFAADDDYYELDAMLPEGPEPTAFRVHSTGAAPAETSG